MSSEGNFLTYCVEQYKYDKNLTGRQTMELFEQYKILEFIFTCCDPLSDGKSYITEDIDLYIEACKKTDISTALIRHRTNSTTAALESEKDTVVFSEYSKQQNAEHSA